MPLENKLAHAKREISALRGQLEQEKARVAELESGLYGIANCAFGYSGCRQTADEAAGWMNDEAMRLLGNPQPPLFILRKQADAVDEIAKHMVRAMTVSDIRMVASLLRKSADKAGDTLC
jgi:hypothetical protein